MPRLFRETYYWKEPDVAKRQPLADQDMLDVAEYLLSLRHDTFQPEALPRDDAHQKMARGLLESVLAGQYSESAAKSLVDWPWAGVGRLLVILCPLSSSHSEL